MRITRDWLLKNYFYDRKNGKFFSQETGEEVELREDDFGILKIKCGMFSYPVHRIAWFMEHNKKPDLVFSKDGNQKNFKLENLYSLTIKEAFQKKIFIEPENYINDPSVCTWECHKIGRSEERVPQKYQAFAMFGYNRHIIGYYDSQEEAHKAFIKFVEYYSVRN